MTAGRKTLAAAAAICVLLVTLTAATAISAGNSAKNAHAENHVKNTAAAGSIKSFGQSLKSLWDSTGLVTTSLKNFIMILAGLFFIYLGIVKQYEPLLLIPIGFGCILVNIPAVGIMEPGGLLYYMYGVGITTGIFPLLIFMGVGSLIDFGPLLADPKVALLGAAAQFGIFATLIGALALSYLPVFPIEFTLREAASIGIIGGADGPTAIYLTSKLADHLLGTIAIAAYSYMALVPIIQPPIMKLLCTKEEMRVKMSQLRHVSKLEKILFPLGVLLLCAIFVPSSVPLVGMLMFGNLIKECGVVERLSKAAQNEILNITTIFLALAVGAKMEADHFLTMQSIGIIVLGLIAFSIGTASGLLMGKLMHRMSGGKINPLIGAAGVSAVPMAARVAQKVGLEANPNNYLLMHAMGPNVAGVIGSALAAGVLLSLVG
ncbi:MAG: sodium ion-translocating decarboxylase subunit beta [Nitrospinota bacterium]